MPAVKYTLNKRSVTLENQPGDLVPVLMRSGERKFLPWLGFIDVNVAKQLPYAIPVRLDVTEYSTETPFMGKWSYLSKGKTVQDCAFRGGVYGITHSVMPRVIARRDQ